MLKPLILFFTLLLALITFKPTLAAEETLLNLLSNSDKEVTVEVDNATIATNTTAQDDQKIQERLKTLYSEINGLENLQVKVSNGVVTLEGELNSSNDEERAVRFARQTTGVVAINDRIQVNRTITRRLNNTIAHIIGMIRDTIVNIPVFLLGALVLATFWKLGRIVAKQHKFYRRFTSNYFVANLIGQIISLLLLLAGLFIALTIMDATDLIKTIVGAAGIVGLAVSFAVRDSVENYIASVLLSLRNPFSVNDHVRIESHEGRVARLNSRATILIALDGTYIRIPNSTVFKASIINYTRNPQRRFSIILKIYEGHEIAAIQSLILQVLDRMPNILKEPKPDVLVQAWEDGNVRLQIQSWVNQTEHSLNRVQSEAIRLIKEVLEEHKVSSPNPTYDIHIMQDTQPPEKVESLAARDLLLDHEIHSHDTSSENDQVIKQIDDQDPAEENLLNPKAPKEL